MDAFRSPDIDALMVHEPFLRRLARAVLRTEEGVEDVVQETWQATLRSGPRDPERARPWLAAVTRNFARKLLRSRKRRAAREGAGRPPGSTPSPSEIAEREETRRRVLDGLLGLDEPYRTTLLLRFYEDLPPREVARRMEAPAETVRTRTRRGLDQLRQALEDSHHGDRRAWILGLVALAGGLPKSAVAATGTAVAKAGLALIPAGVIVAAALGVFSGPAAVEPAPTPPRTAVELLPPVEPPAEGPSEDPPETSPDEPPEPVPVRRPPPVPLADGWKGDGAAPGMVEVPAGTFVMGVDEKWFRKMFRRHPALAGMKEDLWWPILLWETPEHEAETEAYLIDKYEVTNAQFLRFMDEACKRRVRTTEKLSSLYEVAKEVYGEAATSWQVEAIYHLNRRKLHAIEDRVLAWNSHRVDSAVRAYNEGMPRPAHANNFAGLPVKNRIAAWTGFELREGYWLDVYTVTVPRHWPKGRPTEEQLSRPVRYVTAVTAEAFAAWAGKHVPTEEEWENAARGSKGYLYPWGNRWNCRRDPNRLLWKGTLSPPAAPEGDRPIDVDTMREGRSRYGCFHMLGNVMEWTSSSPRKYPNSSSRWAFFGEPRIRAVRGGCWVSGEDYDGRELSLRATSRILEGPDGPIPAGNSYEVLGFRCARYPTPMRDVLSHVLAEVRPLLPEGMELDPARGFGIESPSYRGQKNDPPGKVFVAGRSRGVGFLPVSRLPFATVFEALTAGSRESPVFLGLLFDTVMHYKLDFPGPGVTTKPDYGPKTALLAMVEGRLAVFDLDLSAPRLRGFLRAQGDQRTALRHSFARDLRRSAHLEDDIWAARFRVVIPGRSPTSSSAFELTFRLDSEGAGLDPGPWLETEGR